MKCLDSYGQWSGQSINFEKSCVHFSKNLPKDQAECIASKFGIARAQSGMKYLGLPLLFQGSKKQVFAEVMERVKGRLQGWKAKVLSQAARGTLIRTVAQAMPSYVMSTFLLPKYYCNTLDSLFR